MGANILNFFLQFSNFWKTYPSGTECPCGCSVTSVWQTHVFAVACSLCSNCHGGNDKAVLTVKIALASSFTATTEFLKLF
jgi:hypothetical protein